MFDIGGWEIMIALVIAVIALKPEDVPLAMMKFGRILGRLKYITSEFYRIIEEAGEDEENRKNGLMEGFDPPEIFDDYEDDEKLENINEVDTNNKHQNFRDDQ